MNKQNSEVSEDEREDDEQEYSLPYKDKRLPNSESHLQITPHSLFSDLLIPISLHLTVNSFITQIKTLPNKKS